MKMLPKDKETLRKGACLGTGAPIPGCETGIGYVAWANIDDKSGYYFFDATEVGRVWPVYSFDEETDTWLIDGDGMQFKDGEVVEIFPVGDKVQINL